MKFFLYMIIFSIFFACGGGANSKEPTYEPDPIIGLQGDINAIEPIDLD